MSVKILDQFLTRRYCYIHIVIPRFLTIPIQYNMQCHNNTLPSTSVVRSVMMSLQKRFSDSLLGIIDLGPDDGEGTWKIEETANSRVFGTTLNMLLTIIDVLFPLVGWLIEGFVDDRWYTSSRPLYFYQKDIIANNVGVLQVPGCVSW